MFNFETTHNSELTLARIKYLRLFYYICVIIIPFYFIKNNIQYGFQNSYLVLYPLFVAFVTIPFWCKIQKDYYKIALPCVLLPTIILSIMLFESGGIQAPGVLWIFAVPITFGIVLGRWGGVFGSAYLVAVLILYKILELSGINGAIHLTEETYRVERTVNVMTFSMYIILTVQYFISSEQKSREQLRKYGHEIENLLRVVMHDIATPISVSALSLQQLGDTAASPEKQRLAAGRLRRSLESIGRILEQVRVFKSVRDGKAQLNLEPISVNSCLNSLLSILEAKAELKNIRFNVSTDQKSHWIKGDEVAFCNIILANFLTNAMKFSAHNSTIDVDYRQDGKDVVIRIRDYGVGIPESILEKVWDICYPTSRPGTDGEKGTGYGMPLAKEFIEKMGGEVKINSTTQNFDKQKSGTEVEVRFPTTISPQEDSTY